MADDDMVDAGRLIRLAEYAATPRPSEKRIKRELAAMATTPAKAGMVIAGLLRGATQVSVSSGQIQKRVGGGYYAWRRDDKPLEEAAERAMQIFMAYLNEDTPMAHALIVAVVTRSVEFSNQVMNCALGMSTYVLRMARREAA